MTVDDEQLNTENTSVSIECETEETSAKGIELIESEPLNKNGEIVYTMPEEMNLDIEEVVSNTENEEKQYLFVGDSRTVGMESIISDEATVIAKVGQGYKWLTKTADQQIRDVLTDNTVLIFNLGVNDLANADKYISYLDGLQEEYPETEIFYVSVNPVKNTTVTNEQINAFNDKVKEASVSFIDTNSYLVENGFETPDGLHYSKNTYQEIYDYIVKEVNDAVHPVNSL